MASSRCTEPSSKFPNFFEVLAVWPVLLIGRTKILLWFCICGLKGGTRCHPGWHVVRRGGGTRCHPIYHDRTAFKIDVNCRIVLAAIGSELPNSSHDAPI